MALTTHCPDLEELAAYLDGTSLSAEERARVTEHLASCEACYEIFAGAARYLEDENPAAEEAATMDTEVRPAAEEAVTTYTEAKPAADSPPAGAKDKPENQRAEGAEQDASDPPARPAGPARPFDPAPGSPTRGRAMHRGRFVLPGWQALPGRWVPVALAALLAVAIGWAVIRRLSAPQPVEAMVQLLAPSEAATKAVPWSDPKRGGPENQETGVQFDRQSFQFGVRRFDLQMALAALGRADLGAAADRMCRFISDAADLTTPEVSDACTRIKGRDKELPTDPVAARAQVKELSLTDQGDAEILMKSTKELGEGFLPVLVEMGSWAEACRLGALAAGAGTPNLAPPREAAGVLDFLRGDATRHLLDDSLASHSGTDKGDLDDEGRARLSKVQQLIGKLPAAPGSGTPGAMAEVEGACESLLRNYDDD